MSISINSKTDVLAQHNIDLHHLPCKVDYNGEISTLPQYFKPKMNGNSSNAVFRGKLLDGKCIKLPEIYAGLMINERHASFGEDESRAFDVCGRFDKFTQWHMESQFTNKDTLQSTCSTWLNILSPALHDPI